MWGVQVHVSRATLRDIMAAMRDWLDRHGDPVVQFQTSRERTGILISVDFPTVDLAAAFQREFGGELFRAA